MAAREVLLSASILAADFAALGDQVRQLEVYGADWVHVDVMDGQFVPNISMGPFIVETCRRISSKPLDVHLMIERPELHVEAFAKAGATTLSVHVEGNPNVHRTLQAIRSLGCQPGIVLNPGTPAWSIGSVLPLVDLILVMTVNPGFGGQAFIPEMIEKIAEIRRAIDACGRPIWLEVDGGVDERTAAACRQAGANVLVAGTSIFKHPEGVAGGVQALRAAVR